MNRRRDRRSQLGQRLVVIKRVFTAGWAVILVALLGAGYLVDALPSGKSRPVADRQIVTPPSEVAPELVSELAALATQGGNDPPLILTYHEISPVEDTPYTLTPTAFGEQMRLLAESGYRSIRAADLVDWIDGKPLPPKSVFITFDDGTGGVWRYADPILANYGFTASTFIITSYIGRGTRYLTWQQLVQLSRSGRWDIGAHTRAGHRYLATSAGGAQGAFLTNRVWIESEQRQESLPEYQERVTQDLEGCIADLEAHGVPRPLLFSFPFSAAVSDEAPITEFLTNLTNRLFVASMLDDGVGGVTTPEEKARHQLRRLNVLRSVDPKGFVTEITQSSPLPVNAVYSLSSPGAWRQTSDVGSLDIDAGGVGLRVPQGGWKHVEYQPTRTPFWRDYSVTVTPTGLDTVMGASAGVSLRNGSPGQITVSVSAGWLKVQTGRPATPVYEGRIRKASRHLLQVSVVESRLSVVVDGISIVIGRSVPVGYGGVGLFSSANLKPAAVRFIDGRIEPPW